MKKKYLSIALMLCLSLALTAANIIENTAPLKGKTVGRTVKLTEVLRIASESDKHLLQRPAEIKVAGDGTIFVADKGGLMKFNADGSFVTEMVDHGEGPGEVKYFGGYQVDADGITVAGSSPTKILNLKHDGSLIKEFRVNKSDSICTFMAKYKDSYYFRYKKYDFKSIKSGVQDVDNVILRSDSTGEAKPLDFVAPVKTYLAKHKMNGRNQISIFKIMDVTSIRAGEKYLYVFSSEGYEIHLLDMDKGTHARSFRRPYTSVPYTPSSDPLAMDSVYKREFFNDVLHIMANGEKLWAVTSTIDKEKGILVDEFDTNGKYTDSFHLQLPGLKSGHDERIRQMVHDKGFLYIIEKNDDHEPSIVKYKLEN
ncbi:MAG: 6-bladed beta-propeller [bacterium]|nr:6-bladed beta-propeller [bacterium]